jgi:excisionase family DNA binding protein
MPSRFIPSTGAVRKPVCSHVAELINATYLTKSEAAELARCSTRFLERAVASGRLKALRPTGKFWRVRRSDLDAFLESGATIGGGE